MTAPRTPSADDPGGIALLRQALTAAGYSTHRVPEILGMDACLPTPASLPILLSRLPDEEALSVLLRLFLLGLVVDRSEAEDALRPLPLARAARMGLVRAEGRLVRTPF